MGSNQRPLVPVDQKEPDLKRVSDSTKSGAHGLMGAHGSRVNRRPIQTDFRTAIGPEPFCVNIAFTWMGA